MRKNPSRRRHAKVATVFNTALSLSFGLSFTAFAQDSSDEVLEEVVISGVRASLNQSIAVKQAEDHVVEVISADNMGQMPNVTVAESLVRLPGVNGARDRGNESLATVRGLGPRLTLGTVNGREVASSEPNRNVRWEIYPTEVVSTVKVYKSQSADLVAGGVAGTIDIGTVNPLDYRGPSFVVSGGPVYYDEGKDIPGYNTLGERAGASWVGHINDNLGIAIGATFQKQKNAYPAIGSWGYVDSANAPTGVSGYNPTPWGAGTELKQLDQTRNGVMSAVQWRSDGFELKWDGLYSKIKIDEDQNQMWFNGWDYSMWSGGNPYATAGSSAIVVDGDVVGGTLANSFKRIDHVMGHYNEDKSLVATGLNMKWTGNAWSTTADLSYSAAKRTNQWKAIDFVSFPATVSYNFSRGVEPWITLSSNALDATPDPTWANVGQSAGPEELKDAIGAIALNSARSFDNFLFNKLDVGVRFADRTKKHHYSSWTQAGVGAPLSAFNGLIYSFSMPELNVPQMLGTSDLDTVANIAIGGWKPGLATEDILQRWQVKEKTSEGYVKADFASDAGGVHIKGNIGARIVHVKTTSTGYDQISGVNQPAKDGSTTTDVLPSATVNFLLDDTHILRLAAAKVLARPPLDELRTGRYLDNPATTTGQLTGSGANPQLKPFRATQIDLSFEWYFHKEALLAIAGYTKAVDSTIGYKQDHEQINGHDYLISGPFNGGGGHINGLELTFQTPFYFIPHLENFGIYSNYARVNSDLKEFVPANNPLPLSGLAKDTAAMDLWYSNGKFEARVGYKYHSPYTIIYGWNASAVSRLESESIMDASTAWQITDAVGLKLQVNNLTNEPLRAYFDNKPNRLANKDATGGYQVFGRRYMLEATYKF